MTSALAVRKVSTAASMNLVRVSMNSAKSNSGPSLNASTIASRVVGGSMEYAMGSSSRPDACSTARAHSTRRFFDESEMPSSSNACSAEKAVLVRASSPRPNTFCSAFWVMGLGRSTSGSLSTVARGRVVRCRSARAASPCGAGANPAAPCTASTTEQARSIGDAGVESKRKVPGVLVLAGCRRAGGAVTT